MEKKYSKFAYIIGMILACSFVGFFLTLFTWIGYFSIVKLLAYGLTIKQTFSIVGIFWSLLFLCICVKEDNKKNERLQM